jgi:hypothetical protein
MKGDLMMSQEKETKNPTHTAYVVRQRNDGEKDDWLKVGSAWEHGDQEGMNLILNFLGQKVSVTVRKNKPKS